MQSTSPGVTPALQRLMEETARQAEGTGAFGSVELRSGAVCCTDPVQPAASYRIALDDRGLCVAWTSADRYLSQSIEAEIRWTRENLDDLMDEELADQGYRGGAVERMQHFRNEDKEFVFRWGLPPDTVGQEAEQAAGELVKCLLACQAAFRDLGDMKASEDDGDEG